MMQTNLTNVAEPALRFILIGELTAILIFSLIVLGVFLMRMMSSDKTEDNVLAKRKMTHTTFIGVGFVLHTVVFLQGVVTNSRLDMMERLLIYTVAYSLILYGLVQMFGYQYTAWKHKVDLNDPTDEPNED